MKHIIITAHAKERMTERMRTRPEKMAKAAKKAWESKLVTPRLNYQEHIGNGRAYPVKGTIRYRQFSGHIFIFDETEGAIILVTVIRPLQSKKRILK